MTTKTKRKNKQVNFVCSECGNTVPQWQGQCPACHAYNSIVEFKEAKVAPLRQSGYAGEQAALTALALFAAYMKTAKIRWWFSQ